MSDDPYLIPGTGTLRNSKGITDPARLEVFETRVSAARIYQLVAGEVTIPGRWNLDHLMAHHRHIFADVYPWAGQLRTVSIEKGTTLFCLPENIESAAAAIFGNLARDKYLRGLERSEFVAGAAHVLVEINVLHPAREGNGRAQRAFMLSLARQAGWNLDWSQVDPDSNIHASIAGYRGRGDSERPMVELLDEITSRLPPPSSEPGTQPPEPHRGPSPTAFEARGGPVIRGRDPRTEYRRRPPPGECDFGR